MSSKRLRVVAVEHEGKYYLIRSQVDSSDAEMLECISCAIP